MYFWHIMNRTCVKADTGIKDLSDINFNFIVSQYLLKQIASRFMYFKKDMRVKSHCDAHKEKRL